MYLGAKPPIVRSAFQRSLIFCPRNVICAVYTWLVCVNSEAVLLVCIESTNVYLIIEEPCCAEQVETTPNTVFSTDNANYSSQQVFFFITCCPFGKTFKKVLGMNVFLDQLFILRSQRQWWKIKTYSILCFISILFFLPIGVPTP